MVRREGLVSESLRVPVTDESLTSAFNVLVVMVNGVSGWREILLKFSLNLGSQNYKILIIILLLFCCKD